MNINITRPIVDQSDLRLKLWKLQAKPNVIYVIVTFVFGCVLLIINHSDSILLAVAAFMFLLSFYYAVNLIKSLKSITDFNKKKAAALINIEGSVKIVIDDKDIKYEAPGIKQDITWSLVPYYRIVDNMILLLTSKNYLSSYVIYRTELTDAEFLELEKFLQRNIRLRKNKAWL